MRQQFHKPKIERERDKERRKERDAENHNHCILNEINDKIMNIFFEN